MEVIWTKPLLKQNCIEQVVHESVKKDFEYLQQKRLQNLPGKPVPVLSYYHSKNVFPDIHEESSVFQSVPIYPVTGQLCILCILLFVPPPNPMGLGISSLLKYFLTWSYCTRHQSSLLQINPQVSRSWDSWKMVLLVKTNMKKVFSTSAFFHVLCHQVTWRELAQHLPNLPLFLHILMPFSFCLWHPSKFNSIWAWAFLLHLYFTQVTFSSFHPLYASFLYLSLARAWLIYPCRYPGIFARLHSLLVEMHCSWA